MLGIRVSQILPPMVSTLQRGTQSIVPWHSVFFIHFDYLTIFDIYFNICTSLYFLTLSPVSVYGHMSEGSVHAMGCMCGGQRMTAFGVGLNLLHYMRQALIL